jgi:uncharacterized protein (UPF0297 family)
MIVDVNTIRLSQWSGAPTTSQVTNEVTTESNFVTTNTEEKKKDIIVMPITYKANIVADSSYIKTYKEATNQIREARKKAQPALERIRAYMKERND